VGCLFPALGFFDVYPFKFSFVADHFQYHAAAAGLTAAAAAGMGAAERLGRRREAACAAILACATLGAVTFARTRVFAQSFGRDPEFAAFYRSMQAYEKAIPKGTPMVVPPDGDFFRYMRDKDGVARK
jgi:membrane protease subunit HflC